jgi:hypothetical protein
MKKKTINAIICKKFDDYLGSIKDEKVRGLVEKNSIITGGCIASMLLREDVNDYDVYFTNRETVVAVSEYYVEEFKKIKNPKHADGNKIEIYVDKETDPNRVKIHIKSAGIAGENDNDDYKYFESHPEEEGVSYIENLVSSLTEKEDVTKDGENASPSSERYRPVFLSANAITLANNVQLVIRFFGNPEEIHDNYDYVHCTNYWSSKERKLTLKQLALESLLSKELQYIGSKYPLASVIRSRKFLKRGWTINAGQYLKMAFQISKLDLSDIPTLEDQLIGVDVAYFMQLVDSLKAHVEKEKEEGKEFKLEYGYLATIIDRIF